MTNITEKTAPNVSVGADTEQPSQKCTANIITTEDENFKSFEEIQREMIRMMDPTYLKTVSMTELYDTVYQSKPPLIDGLLYPGTYIFAGAPKLGKSFLMAQLAYHISTGTPLWNYTTRKGTALYLALEDDYRRLQERLYRMFGMESADNLHFSVSASQIGKGLDEQLQGFVTEHPDTKLIIIDTLQKVREVGGDNYSYANDYEIINRIKKFTDRYGICVLIVHHTRKQNADDKFDMISGTTALLGAADGGFILQKEKRTSNNATLEVSGRDQPDQKLHLVRNTETLLWELERVETELWKEPPEPLLEKVAAFITADNAEWCGSPTDLVELLGIDMKANTLSMKLNINAGRLFDEYGICYENKRCHDGRKVKEVIHQVSHSKKWRSEKALDEDGKPILNSKGKQIYHASYSILQDKFFDHMQGAGFTGFIRGERGSTAENLTSLEYKIKQDQKRLAELSEQISNEQVRYDDNHNAFMTFAEIDDSGKKTITGKFTVSAEDYKKLTTLAKRSYSAVSEAKKLQEENQYLSRRIWSLQSEVSQLRQALSELTEKCRPYLEALKAAPKAVKEFIDGILERFKKQEKSIEYEPIPAPKAHTQERGKRSKNKDYER